MCLWSDLGPQFNSDHLSGGWNFQPLDFAANKTTCNNAAHFDLDREGHWQGHRFAPPQCSLWKLFDFDASLGFPGEGPHEKNMTLVSANIGSVMTDVTWKSWGADVVCLQETRVGRNNHRSASHIFKSQGFMPCFGDLLPGLWHGPKSTKTPCGGTLIAGGDAYIRPFDPQCDATGIYEGLFKTKRVVAAWLQVTPRKRALVVSIYAATSASQDPKIHADNNHLFGEVLLFVAQFGPIPVIVAGDFQAPPSSYPAFASALTFQAWHDPVATVDETGEITRPITFSNDCSFAGPGEGCTSIDSILVNDIAFAALISAEVLETFSKQHRPIKLVFQWESINQTGYHLLKTAPLILDQCDGPNGHNQAVDWENSFQAEFESSTTADHKWNVVSRFLQETMIAKGAFWGEGPRSRGDKPMFVTKTIAPKQLPSHCAANHFGSVLARLVGRLTELFTRLSRPMGSAQDHFITVSTVFKARNQLLKLKSPMCWNHNSCPSLVEVHFAKRWAEQSLKTHELSLKLKRIQSWKSRIRQSTSRGCSYIFQHLRNKQQDEPANLVIDAEQNVVFQPNQALATLNNEWDQVFSANVLRHHPLQMLDTVWPYIQDQRVEVDLPKITGHDLFKIIQKRKPTAAPGLDGWRTTELQRLSGEELQPCADFFDLIESTDQPLPKSLVCAKQVILNKPGPSTPLNKRLITILPALLLAYTGARFAQLQDWQQTVMPSSILGGIKGRHMSNLFNQLRLDIDEAKLQQETLIGIKLDKAKAFDRVVPHFVAALFLAFGLPKGFVSFFVKIYDSLHRHLSYRRWTSNLATTAPNGVCQGCSLSLLAMNAYTKVWCHLLDHLPEICVRAYIDDSYLWCKLTQVAVLQKAIEATKVWDLLSGQKLNEGKSSAWGTDSNARRQLKACFPGFPVVLELDVLGTKIYTSERSHFGFPDTKLKKVLGNLDNIAALPVSRSIRSFLIGSKVIPQTTFGAQCTKIPQQAYKSIQNAIARTLWVGQPMWRSKQLLQCVLSKPHRTDPHIADAYNTIVEVSRLCNHSDAAATQLYRTWKSPTGNHSLAGTLKRAFDMLGIQSDEELRISFCGSPAVSFVGLSPKCLSKALQNIARHACYCSIDPKSRKDFAKPTGVFDFHQTTRLLRQITKPQPHEHELEFRLENILVGCTLTNDRLAASGWVNSSLCRFCGTNKECMNHLLSCHKVHEAIGAPVLHEFGSNFGTLGHVSHPKAVARHRLQFSDIEQLAIANSFSAEHKERFWSDGSVAFADCFWLTSAASAVIDEAQEVRYCGSVFHWNLSAYVAELWGVINACSIASFPATIYCDCLSVVEQANSIFDGGTPDCQWACLPWWHYLMRLTQVRRAVHDPPFRIKWIPAHCFEGIPIEILNEELAALRGTTLEHVSQNRLADASAKECALQNACVFAEVQREATQAIKKHQLWLTELHSMLPTFQPDRAVIHETKPQAAAANQADCEARFPLWPWRSVVHHFKWKPKIPNNIQCPRNWTGDQHDWESCCRFLCTLRWHVEASLSVSFHELAIAFHVDGYKLNRDFDLTTFHDIYKVVRETVQLLGNVDTADCHPGSFNSTKPRCCGRVLLQGCITGAAPFFDDAKRVVLAQLFTLGAGRTLSSWKLPLI